MYRHFGVIPPCLYAYPLVKDTAFLADADIDRTRIRVTVDSTSYIKGLNGHWSFHCLAAGAWIHVSILAGSGKDDKANATHCRDRLFLLIQIAIDIARRHNSSRHEVETFDGGPIAPMSAASNAARARRFQSSKGSSGQPNSLGLPSCPFREWAMLRKRRQLH